MIELIAQNPILAALIALVGLSIVFGGLLGFAAEKFKIEGDPVIDQIDSLLPQTQCGQCGFPGCRPMQNLLLMVTQSINALPAVSLQLMPLQTCLMSLRPN